MSYVGLLTYNKNAVFNERAQILYTDISSQLLLRQGSRFDPDFTAKGVKSVIDKEFYHF